MHNASEKCLSLAKQGNIQAINTCLNYLLEDLEITVRGSIQKNLIELILDTPDGIPEEQISCKYIKNFFQYLQIPALYHVKIYAKQSPANSLAWSREFYIIEQIQTSLSLPYSEIYTARGVSGTSHIKTNTEENETTFFRLLCYLCGVPKHN